MSRIRWRLFLATWLLIALVTRTTPESAHEYSRLGTVESLVERGTYRLDDSTFIDTLDKIHRDDHFYSHQTPLLATLESPVYAMLRASGARFNNSGRLVLTYAFSLLTNGAAFALTVLVFFNILTLGGTTPRWASALALLLPMGTWLLPYATVANNHGISGLLLACIVYLLMRIDRGGATGRLMLLLGAALGLLAAIELLPLISFVPLVTAYLLARREMSPQLWARFAAAALVPVVLQSLINIRITGDIVPAGFHHELFNYPGTSFTPESLTGTVKHGSISEFTEYARRVLFTTVGYFTFAPLLLLAAIAGIVQWQWWARAGAVHLVLTGGTLASFTAALLTTNNSGGAAVGFRHAAYLAPAMLPLLLPWLTGSGRQRAAVTTAAAASALSLVLFAVPNPWAPLTVQSAATAAWQAYVPLLGHLFAGTLLRP